MKTNKVVLVECGSCGAYHPQGFDEDCRDDSNRFGGPEDYAERTDAVLDTIETVEPGSDD